MSLWSALIASLKRNLSISFTKAFKWTGHSKGMDTKELTINRSIFTEKSTIGELWLDGRFQCYTLEDTCRQKKIAGVTAIPAGHYQVTINFSEKFKRDMPLLLNVPNFDGVRIHWGNKAEDSEGCILVGKGKDADFISSSKAAFDELFPIIQTKLNAGPLFVSILGGNIQEAA